MRKSEELVKDRDAWMRKYARENKQRDWENIVNSYARWKKMVETGKKLNHQATIDYYNSCMHEAEKKFPQLKNVFK